MTFLPEQTIAYKTYIKTSLVTGLRAVFANHPDSMLAKTKVTLDYPTSSNSYPTVIVRFYERGIHNIGIGHAEYLMPSDQTISVKFKHYLYDGDIEFAILALSSLDRDLISDALIQTITMGDLLPYTNNFFTQIYGSSNPADDYTYVNINSDKISGFGETQTPQPWLAEDQLVYQTAYRTGIYGEFYSLPPVYRVASGNVRTVTLFPYTTGEPLPTGSNDPSIWQ